MNRHKRRFSGWIVRFAVSAAIGCLALGLPVAAQASPPPEVQIEPAEQTPTGFRLKAEVNPEGSPTTYYFIYKKPGEIECEDLEGCGPETAHAGPLTGDTQQEVQAEVTGLTAGQQYAYWLIARNASPEAVRSGELTFTTPLGPPSIDSESVSNVTEHDATLEATIDTNNVYTGYEFQIDTNASYDLPGPVCPFEFIGDGECEAIRVGEPLPAGLVEPQPTYIPAGSGDQSVSLHLASIGATLQPSTSYHYRVIAASGSSATVAGPDQTFTTPAPQLITGGAQSAGGGQSTDAQTAGGTSKAACPNNVSSTGCAVADLTPSHEKRLTRAQELAKALEQCKKEPKRRRAKCEKQATKHFGPEPGKKSKDNL